MKPKVVITQWIHEEVIEYMSLHCDPVLNTTGETLSREEIIESAKDARGMMVFMSDCIDEDFLRRCPHLEIIGAALKGFDNFDVDACTRHGIWFTIVRDLLTIPTAEITLGLLMGLSRNLIKGDHLIRKGTFTGWKPILYGAGLYGSVVGIIGMGAVGKAIAKRLRGFEANVIYYDKNTLPQIQEDKLKAKAVSLEELLQRSDFIIPMLPLTPDTTYFIDRKALTRVKKGSYLINTGRGSVVDERAVADALASGRLAGYAADVFEMEDWARKHHPRSIPRKLVELKQKTLFTPHLGSAVDSIRREITFEAAKNILQGLKGEKPQGSINDPIPLESKSLKNVTSQ